MKPIGIAIAIVWQVMTAAASAQPSIERLFADAGAKEQAVRAALSNPSVTEAALKAVRTVVADYEAIVRRFPSSAYCDDALWRAGQLSLEAHARFGAAEDKAAGIRLLRAVISEYPSSRFAKQAPAVIAAAQARPAPQPGRPASSRAPASRQAPPAVPVKTTGAARTGAERVVTIRDIRRVVLPDAVRIVIELDGEVPEFHDERLANPVRVFVDLSSTRAAPELVDRTIRFDTDGDVVRQVRLGRHPNATTRVVVDASGISTYSVYPLYSPYRLVIDFFKEMVAVPVLPLLGRRTVAPAVASLPRAPSPLPLLPRDTPVLPLPDRRIVSPAAASLPRPPSPPPLSPREMPPSLPLPSTAIKTRPLVINAPATRPLTAALEGMAAAAATVAALPSTTTTRPPLALMG
jgi:hypothetical protein